MSGQWAVLPVGRYDDAAVGAAIASGVEPATPEEYLARVRYESLRLPDVVVRSGDEVDEAIVTAPSPAVAARPPPPPARPGGLGDAAWEAAIVADFEALRRALSRWAARAERVGFRPPVPPARGSRAPPSPRDARAWAHYALGGSGAGDAAPPPPKRSRAWPVDIEDLPSSGEEEEDDEDDDDDDDEGTGASDGVAGDRGCAAPHRTSIVGGGGQGSRGVASAGPAHGAATAAAAVGTPPLLRTLLAFDQVATTRALRRLVAEADARVAASARAAQPHRPAAGRGVGSAAAAAPRPPLCAAEAAWLYAFLARLEKPLLADTAALVRQLYTLVSRLRDGTPPAAATATEGAARRLGSHAPGGAPALVASLDVLAVVAGRYFSQRLAGEA